MALQPCGSAGALWGYWSPVGVLEPCGGAGLKTTCGQGRGLGRAARAGLGRVARAGQATTTGHEGPAAGLCCWPVLSRDSSVVFLVVILLTIAEITHDLCENSMATYAEAKRESLLCRGPGLPTRWQRAPPEGTTRGLSCSHLPSRCWAAKAACGAAGRLVTRTPGRRVPSSSCRGCPRGLDDIELHPRDGTYAKDPGLYVGHRQAEFWVPPW